MNSRIKLVTSPFPGYMLPEQSLLFNWYDEYVIPAGRGPLERGTTNLQAFRNNNKKLKHNKNLSHSIQFNSRRPFMPWHRVYSNANGNERLEKRY